MSISVIIPAYNSMPYLRETLQSIFNQTHQADEILVIDDGSTDWTVAFAESFGPKIRVFHRSRQRQASNRNFGAEQTSCEWLAFLDHDDLWEPNKLERQIDELSRHPDADLCYTARVTFIQEGDNFVRDKIFPVPPAQDIKRALYVNTTFMPGSVLIRRSTFLASGGFDPKLKLVEDWDLWLRLLHGGTRFAACQEPLLLHRIHANMQSNNAMEALAEVKGIYRRHVLPRLSPATRWIKHQISQSGQESTASYILREVKDPRYLSMMATSILRYPFNDPHRYKVLAHMLFTRLKQVLG
jgi:glycosyltransferase involved in cell wall biosynthesis